MISPQFDPNFLTNLLTIPSEGGAFLTKNSQNFDSLNNGRFSSQVESQRHREKTKVKNISGARNTRGVVYRALVIDAFRDAVQMPLRKESRFRRSPLVVGWFCLVLEHAAGGCRRRLQERRTLKLVEARRVGIEGRSPGWSTPMRRTSFDSIRKLNRGIGQNRGDMI